MILPSLPPWLLPPLALPPRPTTEAGLAVRRAVLYDAVVKRMTQRTTQGAPGLTLRLNVSFHPVELDKSVYVADRSSDRVPVQPLPLLGCPSQIIVACALALPLSRGLFEGRVQHGVYGVDVVTVRYARQW